MDQENWHILGVFLEMKFFRNFPELTESEYSLKRFSGDSYTL